MQIRVTKRRFKTPDFKNVLKEEERGFLSSEKKEFRWKRFDELWLKKTELNWKPVFHLKFIAIGLPAMGDWTKASPNVSLVGFSFNDLALKNLRRRLIKQ